MNESINECLQPPLRPGSPAPFRSPHHTEGPRAGLSRPFAGACAGSRARPEVAGGFAPRARAPGEGRGGARPRAGGLAAGSGPGGRGGWLAKRIPGGRGRGGGDAAASVGNGRRPRRLRFQKAPRSCWLGSVASGARRAMVAAGGGWRGSAAARSRAGPGQSRC